MWEVFGVMLCDMVIFFYGDNCCVSKKLFYFFGFFSDNNCWFLVNIYLVWSLVFWYEWLVWSKK